MACPICGAKCKCRKAGPGGLCCSCHKHKPRPIRADFKFGSVDELDASTRESWTKHIQALEHAGTDPSLLPFTDHESPVTDHKG
jgi:hypothetical protein